MTVWLFNYSACPTSTQFFSAPFVCVCSNASMLQFLVCFIHRCINMMMLQLCEINCWLPPPPPPPKGPVLSCAAMSAKAISEQTGKEFLYKYICTAAAVQNRFRYASVTAETDWDRLTQEHSWLLTEVRPDCNRPRYSLSKSLQLAERYWNHEANYTLHATETLCTRFVGHYIITVACDRVFRCIEWLLCVLMKTI